MGLFKSIKKIAKSVIKDPLKALTIIGSAPLASTFLVKGKTGKTLQTVAKAGTAVSLAVFAPQVLPIIGGAQTIGAAVSSRAQKPTAQQLAYQQQAQVKAHLAQGTVQKTAVQGGSNMGLDIGGLLSGVGQLLGGVSAVPYAQGVGQVVTAFAPAFSQPAAQNFGPVYSPQPIYSPSPMATPVMSSVPVIAAGAGAVARMTAPILFQISSKLGRRVSLSHAISIIRRMGKMLMDPAAIAVALGVGLGELATLITAHSSRKSRHMNPANGKALRRAARRIKGFHRMCTSIDLLKSRGRRAVRSAPCGTCRKSPCRC